MTGAKAESCYTWARGGGLFNGAFSCSYTTACTVCECDIGTEHRRALEE